MVEYKVFYGKKVPEHLFGKPPASYMMNLGCCKHCYNKIECVDCIICADATLVEQFAQEGI